jgi:hypothetical protein
VQLSPFKRSFHQTFFAIACTIRSLLKLFENFILFVSLSFQCIPIYVGEVVTSHVTKKTEKTKIFFSRSPQVLRRALTFDRSTSAKIKNKKNVKIVVCHLATSHHQFSFWSGLEIIEGVFSFSDVFLKLSLHLQFYSF